MKLRTSILIASYITFVVFTISSFLYNESGYFQYKKYKKYKEVLSLNVMELSDKNSKLFAEYTSLSLNGEASILAAREIGYFGKNQGVIRFGTTLGKTKANDYGNILKYNNTFHWNKSKYLLFSFLTGLFCFFILIIISKKRFFHK